MATVAIPGVEFGEEYEHPEGEAMGKPVMASFTRSFVVASATPRDVVRAVERLAEANGWTTYYVDGDSYRASKTMTIGGRRITPEADLGLTFASPSAGVLRVKQR